MHSIFHFFKDIVEKKKYFLEVKKLHEFPFDETMLSCKNVEIFPDMTIRLNPIGSIFTGGELIELKDSNSYTVSSFNSTVPTGSKEINKIVTGEKGSIKKQMEEAGNNIFSLPIREVFYLVRGKKKGNIKVCLIHGNFFETLKVDELIQQSFGLVLEERLKESGVEIPDEWKKKILAIFSQQENFSRVRNIEKASVKLRFRIMTEVKAEGNILNSRKYPEIKDNTLNFILPLNSGTSEDDVRKFKTVFGSYALKEFEIFKIKHHLNGYFLVFQINI